MDAEPPIVLHSAARHGVADEDALHAWAFATAAYDLDEGMIMYIGPDRAGNLLEIGVAGWHNELAIVHAMRARSKFVR
ncbi:MAG: hypothetical protein WD011_01450 [Nitriliruptoraceae bacterium]